MPFRSKEQRKLFKWKFPDLYKKWRKEEDAGNSGKKRKKVK